MPSPKYLRVVLHSMGLTNCKPAPTTSGAGSVKQNPDDDADLDMQACRLYCGIGGSLHLSTDRLSIDRCDVQCETNACAKEMKQPTKASWTRLKRFARHLAGTQSARVVLMKPATDNHPHGAFLRVWSDIDGAGNVKDRKSQSSLKIEVGVCPLFSASRKQKAHAHSSGEAEYAAASAPVKQCCSEKSCRSRDRKFGQNSFWIVQPHVAYADVKVLEPYNMCQQKYFGYNSW